MQSLPGDDARNRGRGGLPEQHSEQRAVTDRVLERIRRHSAVRSIGVTRAGRRGWGRWTWKPEKRAGGISMKLSLAGARALHLGAQGLHALPAGPARKEDVLAAIRRMAGLQIDSISVVAR